MYILFISSISYYIPVKRETKRDLVSVLRYLLKTSVDLKRSKDLIN